MVALLRKMPKDLLSSPQVMPNWAFKRTPILAMASPFS